MDWLAPIEVLPDPTTARSRKSVGTVDAILDEATLGQQLLATHGYAAQRGGRASPSGSAAAKAGVGRWWLDRRRSSSGEMAAQVHAARSVHAIAQVRLAGSAMPPGTFVPMQTRRPRPARPCY